MAEESTEAVENEDQQSTETGADSEEGKAQQREESDPAAGEAGEGGDSEDGKGEEAQKAQEKEEEREQAREKVKELEEGDPPADLEDWPDDAAKYETFGGPEGEHGYHEGPEEEKLGPSSLRHGEDGQVTIAGEEVDDPDEYKSDPIPGGPTDPDAPQDLTTQKIREDQGRELESEDGDGGDSESESDDDDSSEAKAASDGDAESKSDDD
jgi:hypothetical protein